MSNVSEANVSQSVTSVNPAMRGFTLTASRGPAMRGFTLIELLVVISIIVILTSIGATVFSRAQMGARDSRRKADLESLRVALEQYFPENKRYISTSGSWVDVCATPPGSCPTLQPLVPGYLKVQPTDPSGTAYLLRYNSLSGGQTFCLSARLEIPPSPALSPCSGYSSAGASYNYYLGSP